MSAFAAVTDSRERFKADLDALQSGGVAKGVSLDVVQDETMKAIWSYVNLWSHMEEFGKGIVDTRRVVYYLSGAVLALYTAVRVVEALVAARKLNFERCRST